MTHQLEADSIQLQFGERKVLSSIYIKSETGKITGLLGRNGQGKSCLMKLIYGTLNAEKSVRIDSRVQQELYKRPDLLLYLPQFNFIPKFLTLKRIFQDYGLDYQPFVEILPEFASKYNASIGSLSGGTHRLVEIYIILKSKSQFAMLDEPFTHLSPLQIEKVKELLLKEKEGKGILITDHMFRQVLTVCDNLYVLSNGATHLTKTFADIETLGYAKINGC